MANIIDYIKWRGDLELKNSEFNEIDSLILNRFSYFPLDNIIEEDETLSIKELGERVAKEDKNKLDILWEDDAVGTFDVKLSKEDIDYLEEMYLPHKVVGAL